jgi:serine/threonine-protein kinase HipA
LIKRFDREKTENGYLRARMVSGLTVLRAEESAELRTNWSYVLLVEELRRIVAEAKKDARELFRRVCFNALISNLDDHPRNHALIARDEHWKLSPAYDLTPSPAVSQDRRDLAMELGDLGRYANRKNLLSQCGRFLLVKEEAETIAQDMTIRVSKWYDMVRSWGVSERDAETIRSSFLYPGFFY